MTLGDNQTREVYIPQSLYKETSILTTVHWIHFFFHCYNFAEEKSSKKLFIVKCQVPDKIFSSSVTMSVTTWCWLYITVLHAIFVWLDLVRNLTHIVRPQRATIQIEKTWSHFSNQIITLFFFFFMNQKSHPYPTTSVLLLWLSTHQQCNMSHTGSYYLRLCGWCSEGIYWTLLLHHQCNYMTRLHEYLPF